MQQNDPDYRDKIEKVSLKIVNLINEELGHDGEINWTKATDVLSITLFSFAVVVEDQKSTGHALRFVMDVVGPAISHFSNVEIHEEISKTLN